jgi:hypothetical protein
MIASTTCSSAQSAEIFFSIRRWSHRHQFITNIISFDAFTFHDVFRILSKFIKFLHSFTFLLIFSFFVILSFIFHHLTMIVSLTFLNWSTFFLFSCDDFSYHTLLRTIDSFSFVKREHRLSLLSDTNQEFMNEKIVNHIEKISFQIRDFLRTNHRFDNLIFVDIKSFVSNIIKSKNSSITSKSARKTRSSKSSNITTWSQIWAIDREKFKKAIISFEKVVELSFSFSRDHSRESFKEFINFVIESFVNSKLILSESFSSLTRTSTNIANQIVNARDSSSLISISSDFENSASVRSFSKFDFTSRFYETSQKTNSVFVISKKNSKTSSFEFIRTNSVLNFVENSKASSIAQKSTRKTMNSAKSIFILQFVLQQNSTFSNQFSSRSITSESDKQTVRTSANYEISRNTSAVESSSAFNMFQEFIETQRRELMIMMQEFWTQRSTFTAFFAASSITQAFDQRSERWVTTDLEFFDSIYDDKILITAEWMQHADKISSLEIFIYLLIESRI